MAQYDVTHIDIGRYRELRRLVQDGRARAVIMVDYLDANAPPLVKLAPAEPIGVSEVDDAALRSYDRT